MRPRRITFGGGGVLNTRYYRKRGRHKIYGRKIRGKVMSFLKETYLKSLGEGAFKPTFKAVIIGNSGGFFQGVRSVNKFSDSEIVMCVKGESVTVCGENMFVKKFCEGDVIICGKINCVKRA